MRNDSVLKYKCTTEWTDRSIEALQYQAMMFLVKVDWYKLVRCSTLIYK